MRAVEPLPSVATIWKNCCAPAVSPESVNENPPASARFVVATAASEPASGPRSNVTA